MNQGGRSEPMPAHSTNLDTRDGNQPTKSHKPSSLRFRTFLHHRISASTGVLLTFPTTPIPMPPLILYGIGVISHNTIICCTKAYLGAYTTFILSGHKSCLFLSHRISFFVFGASDTCTRYQQDGRLLDFLLSSNWASFCVDTEARDHTMGKAA